jgi:hypothetical protein
MTAADGKDEAPSDIPKTSSSTIPATIILPASFLPTTATASATISLDATSASTKSSGNSNISSQSSEPPPASDYPNPTFQEQGGYKQPQKPYTTRFDPQTTADGKYTVQDVPNHYSLIYGSTLAELQQDAKSYHKLKNALLGQAKCNWNPLAHWHLAARMMQSLYASFTRVEQLIPCVVAGIFAAAGIKVDTKSLPQNCPSRNLLKEIFRDGAVDCLLCLMDELKKAHAVFLACDKGNQKGADHLAKVISWWDETERCVRSVRTLLQLVHSFLDLQNCLTHKERHGMWDLANGLDADYNGHPPNSIQEAATNHKCH